MVFKNQHVQSFIHKDALFQALTFQHYGLSPKVASSKKLVRVGWEKPQVGWCCVSTDGYTSTNSGRAGCGGLIRDAQGEWVGGFSKRLRCLDSFIAELWGLRDGLMLCKNMNLNAMKVQLDPMAVVQLLTSPTITNLSILPLIDDCKQLISQIAQVSLIGGMHMLQETQHSLWYGPSATILT